MFATVTTKASYLAEEGPLLEISELAGASEKGANPTSLLA
jgi:hypothetical protein